jgi:hypothetical protein
MRAVRVQRDTEHLMVGRGQPSQVSAQAAHLHGGEVAVAVQREMAKLRIGHGAAVDLDVAHPIPHSSRVFT